MYTDSHGRRSLVGCSPWGCEESDMAERVHFHFSLLCLEEGNGNPLQCSCLENPRDEVAQSRTRLKWYSSSIHICVHVYIDYSLIETEEINNCAWHSREGLKVGNLRWKRNLVFTVYTFLYCLSFFPLLLPWTFFPKEKELFLRFINLTETTNKTMNYIDEALHKIQGETDRNTIAMGTEPLTNLFQGLAVE